MNISIHRKNWFCYEEDQKKNSVAIYANLQGNIESLIIKYA